MKVLFIGCNPSNKNSDPNVPFIGTKSGKTLSGWISELGLTQDMYDIMNLTKYATQNQSKLKKSDVDLEQFKFELGVKLIALYHGDVDALSMIISKMQSIDKVLPNNQFVVPNPPDVVKEDLEKLKSTPLAKIVVLGEMAEWGIKPIGLPYFKLPHPSGLNHKLNDKEFLKNKLAECKAWLYNLSNG